MEVSNKAEEERDCLNKLLSCLKSCLNTLSIEQFKTDQYDVVGEQLIECFDLLCLLLESNVSPERLQHLLFNGDTKVFKLLFSFLKISPEPPEDEQSYIEYDELMHHIRFASLNTLSKIISLLGEAEEKVAQDLESLESGNSSISVHSLRDQCITEISAEYGLETLLDLLDNSPHDTIRQAVAENLFVLVLKNELPSLSVLLKRGLDIFLKRLEDTSALVRGFVCGILREFSSFFSNDIISSDFMRIALNLIKLDASPDVRALCCETLEALCQNDFKAIEFFDMHQTCARILAQRVENETNDESLCALCKLLETLFSLKVYNFTSDFVHVGGYNNFIKCINKNADTACLAIRSLRHLLQNTSDSHAVGEKIVSKFQTLSVMLKAVLQYKKPSQRDSISIKLLKVELAITIGLILTESPENRSMFYKELKNFPEWMGNLRTVLLKSLSYAEVEYFSDVVIVDSSGTNLLHYCNSNYALVSQISNIFLDQEHRRLFENEESTLNHYENMDTTEKGKFNAAILSYAIHLTMSPNAADEMSELSNHTKLNTPKKHSETLNSSMKTKDGTRRLLMTFDSPVSLFSQNSDFNNLGSRLQQFRDQKRKRKRSGEKFKAKHSKALKTAIKFSSFYSEKPEKKVTVPSPRPTEFSKILDKKDVFVWEQKEPNIMHQPTKAWTIYDPEPEDIFSFHIAHDYISKQSIESVVEDLQKHKKKVKRIFSTCPAKDRGRRSFLYDSLHNILPEIQNGLEHLLRLCKENTTERIKVALIMHPEGEVHDKSYAHDIDIGNLFEMNERIDQFLTRFRQNTLYGFSEQSYTLDLLNSSMAAHGHRGRDLENSEIEQPDVSETSENNETAENENIENIENNENNENNESLP